MGLPVETNVDWEKRINVVRKYLATGSVRRTAELCNVSPDMIHRWKNQDWWDELVTELRRTQDAKTETRITTLVERALDIVEDRLINGDLVLNNKTGELIRKPVSMKDTAKLTTDLLQRQSSLRKDQGEVKIQKETVKETLQLLASEFSRWNKRSAVLSAEDVKIKDAEGSQEVL